MVYEGNWWLGYDRRFRQDAAARHLAFTGAVKRSRCVHCLSLTHKSPQCNWADTPDTPPSTKYSKNWQPTQVDPRFQNMVSCGTVIHIQVAPSQTANFSICAHR